MLRGGKKCFSLFLSCSHRRANTGLNHVVRLSNHMQNKHKLPTAKRTQLQNTRWRTKDRLIKLSLKFNVVLQFLRALRTRRTSADMTECQLREKFFCDALDIACWLLSQTGKVVQDSRRGRRSRGNISVVSTREHPSEIADGCLSVTILCWFAVTDQVKTRHGPEGFTKFGIASSRPNTDTLKSLQYRLRPGPFCVDPPKKISPPHTRRRIPPSRYRQRRLVVRATKERAQMSFDPLGSELE